MQLTTVRIELTNGGWAILYKDLLRRTTRMHEALIREHMEPIEEFGRGGKVLLSTLESSTELPKQDYMVDLAAVSPDEVNAVYILGQVAEWSLGDVSPGVLSMITDADYKALVKEMDRLYKPSPLPESSESDSAKAST